MCLTSSTKDETIMMKTVAELYYEIPTSQQNEAQCNKIYNSSCEIALAFASERPGPHPPQQDVIAK